MVQTNKYVNNFLMFSSPSSIKKFLVRLNLFQIFRMKNTYFSSLGMTMNMIIQIVLLILSNTLLRKIMENKLKQSFKVIMNIDY
jgi:hypothetical protein